MNELKIFENEKFGQIRTVEVDGKTYFVASDVAKSLGYVRPNDAISAHCRYTAKHHIPHPQSKSASIEVNIIPEGDVYRLVAHSNLPASQEFESWVFDEVLPSIRETGKYNALPDFANPSIAARAWADQYDAKLLAEAKVIELVPKAKVYDAFVDKAHTVGFRDFAKELGIQESYFREWLISTGFIYMQKHNGRQRMKPYADTVKKGWAILKDVKSDVYTGVQLRFTMSGKQYIHGLMEAQGLW